MRAPRRLAIAGFVLVAHSATAGAASQQQDSSCERFGIRAARSRGEHADLLGRVGLLASFAAVPLLLKSPRIEAGRVSNANAQTTGLALAMAGSVSQLLGIVVSTGARTSLGAWDHALSALRVGESTMADVRSCFGEPSSRTWQAPPASPDSTTLREETWAYRSRRSSFFGSTTLRVVTITFRDRLLKDIRVTDSR